MTASFSFIAHWLSLLISSCSLMFSNFIFSISTLNFSSCTDSTSYCFFINMAWVTVVLVDDFAFLGPQGVLQVGKLKVLLLSMSVVLGDCCTTSLILRIQDVCKSEELKVSEKEKIRIKITKYIVRYERTSTFYVMPKWTNNLYFYIYTASSRFIILYFW